MAAIRQNGSSGDCRLETGNEPEKDKRAGGERSERNEEMRRRKERKKRYSLFEEFGVAFSLLKSINVWLLEMCDGIFINERGKIVWRCATCSLLWSLWKERNNRLFEDKFSCFESFWILVQHNAS